jgi:hypothetical protein
MESLQVTPEEGSAQRPRPMAARRKSASRWYSVYGLRARSAVPLPLPPVQSAGPAAADTVIRLGRAPDAPAPDGPRVLCRTCAVHGDVLTVHRGPGGAWIWHQGVGTFHVSPDARQVDVFAEPEADPRAIGHLLIQPVLLFVRHRLGVPSLHAGAVATSDGGVAFVGPSRQGKSTLTAAFMRRGATLVTDDALLLKLRDGTVYGAPGPAFMKVWRETAEHALELDHPAELPDLMDQFEKKMLALQGRYAQVQSPVPLRAVYVLARYDAQAAGRADITIEPLSGRETLAALLLYGSNREYLLPAEEAAFLPTYAALARQAPVKVLRYPSGFEHLDAVHARLQADLQRMGGL